MATPAPRLPGVVCIEGADILHPRHQIVPPIGGVDALALALDFGGDAGGAQDRGPKPERAASRES
jgi:hypothetical protein